MPITVIDVEQFNALRKNLVVLDVRSPSEYAYAHVPCAISFPIFSDEERKIIGTLYKQTNRESAVIEGLKFFGHNLQERALSALQLIKDAGKDPSSVIVHCWRGGMRSGAVVWLLNLFGLQVYQLAGGYKAWRTAALARLEQPRKFKLINGYTGSNKTGVINRLAATGEPAIDLEGLAGHKGSAFGNLDLIPQPSQEQFENLLSEALRHWDESKPGAAIWLEAENQRIGLRNLPTPFFSQMKAAPHYFLMVPFEVRLDFITTHYGKHDTEKIINAIVRIQKKLGGKETRECIHLILEGNIKDCFRILLAYYDRLYLRNSPLPTDPHSKFVIPTDTINEQVNLLKLPKYD